MLGKFVAINIYINALYDNSKKILLNPTESPLIYYWDENEELIDCLFSEQPLKEWIIELCKDNSIFEDAKVCIFYLENEGVEGEDFEKFRTETVSIQDILPIELIDKETYYKYFLDILNGLYVNVYKEKYESNITDLDDKTRDIYNKIISGVKREILLSTVSLYIHKTLRERTKLTEENILKILKIFNNIIERTQ